MKDRVAYLLVIGFVLMVIPPILEFGFNISEWSVPILYFVIVLLALCLMITEADKEDSK